MIMNVSFRAVLLLVSLLTSYLDAFTTIISNPPSSTLIASHVRTRDALQFLLLPTPSDTFQQARAATGSTHQQFSPLHANNNNDNDDDVKEDEEAVDMVDRVGFVRQVLGITNTGMSDKIKVGDVVIAKNEIPNLSIEANEGYEIVAIYDQSIDKDSGFLVKTPIESIDTTDESIITTKSSTSTLYIQLLMNKNKNEIVTVTPEEIGLVTIKNEFTNAMWLAIPGFFWVFVAYNFAHYYQERYGGTFLDAMFRT